MTGEAHWLPFAFVMLSAVSVAFLWLRDWREERKYLVEQRCVRCRDHGNKLAQCTLVRDARSHQPMGIRSCSEAAEGHCDKTCLPLFATAS